MAIDDAAANQILAGVFQKYPALSKGNDPKNTFAMIGTPERTKLAGQNQLEYWPASETGTPDFPHPRPGATVLEIYNDSLKNNPDLMGKAFYGDLLHGMKNDPTFGAMRKEFSGNFTPEALGRHGGNIDDSTLDAYIRGMISPDQNDEWRKNQMQSGKVYSDKQMDILRKMMVYLHGGGI